MAQSWHGEHRFDHERAAYQEAELQAKDGNGRQQRVAQHVLQEHQPVGQPLGARCAHKVGAHGDDDLAAQVADQHRRKLQRQGERWQEQVPDVVLECLAEASHRKPLESE